MEKLSNEMLCEIFSLVDYRAICRISICCKQLRIAADTEKLWAMQCEQWWGITEKPDTRKTWKEVFRDFYLEWGRYISCYKTIRSLWDQIFELLTQRSPAINQTLLPGLSEEVLTEMEEERGVKLPVDYQCSYKICNGQEPIDGHIGLFGCDRNGDVGGHFLWPIKTQPRSVDELLQISMDYRTLSHCFDSVWFRKVGMASHRVVPMTFYSMHTVMNNYDRVCNKFMITAWKNTEIEPGIFSYLFGTVNINDISMTSEDAVVVLAKHASSMTEFLRKRLDQMRQWPVADGKLLRYLPNNSVTTGPFRVDVSVGDESVLNPYYSLNGTATRMWYGYRITMSMDANASNLDSCQLETRHWTITDSKGRVEQVAGPGVVGENPVMRPGASFSWISGTNFGTLRGTMDGHFMMRNLDTGNPVRIDCARMTFRPEAEKLVWIDFKKANQAGFDIEEVDVNGLDELGLDSVTNPQFRKWLSDFW